MKLTLVKLFFRSWKLFPGSLTQIFEQGLEETSIGHASPLEIDHVILGLDTPCSVCASEFTW